MSDCVFDLGAVGAIRDVNADCLWTGDDIRRAVALRAAKLAGLGAQRGERVLIAHGGRPEFFVDLFAAWSLGACAACVNPQLTASELANIIAFTEPRVVLSGDAEPPGALPGTVRSVEGLAPRSSGPGTATALRCVPDAAALILFTSGTTGNPKGVVHSFASLRARIDHNLAHMDPTALARSLCVLPTHFGHGLIGNCLTPLFAGGELLLAPGGGIAAAARLAATLDEYAVSFMSSVPAWWKLVLKTSAPPRLQTLRQVSVGSAPVSAELVRAISAWAGTNDVRNMYGITETANWAAGSSALERAPEDGLVGTMWGGSAAIRDDDGRIRDNGSGELLLRPPSLMTGYFRRPDLTAEAVRDSWYHTGDIGHIDDSGVIRLTGRSKYEINRAGMKVSPEEIDLLLERHESVIEACAFALPDEIAGEIVAVAVHLDPERPVTPETLRAWCLECIRRECIPERWFVLDEIPKTDRGKLNRDRVRQACLQEVAA